MRFIGTIDKKLLFLILLPLLACVIVVYYVYYTTDPRTNNPGDYYPLLGDAFVSGQTYLKLRPKSSILNVENPYDMRAREGTDFQWDLSLYDNKYYLYFGPVPALLWAAVKLATGYVLHDSSLTFLFCCGGTFFISWLVCAIAMRAGPYSRIALMFCLLSLCFGTWIPFLLRRPAFYEAAISGGYCFTALGLLLLWYGLNEQKAKKCLWLIGLASLSFGVAVASRMTMGLNAGILFVAWIFILRNKPAISPITAMLCMACPWLFCIEGLAVYNYVRFGNPFETGMRFQLAQQNLNDPNFDPVVTYNFIPYLYLYFIRPFELRPDFSFPYFSVNFATYSKYLFSYYNATAFEPAYGTFTNSPFSLWLFATPYLWWKRRKTDWQLSAITSGLSLFSIAMTCFLCTMFYIVQRYAIDLIPWLMFLACVIYLRLIAQTSGRARIILLCVGGLMAFYGVAVGLLAGCHEMEYCK